jgi:hypothetical protein
MITKFALWWLARHGYSVTVNVRPDHVHYGPPAPAALHGVLVLRK